MKMKTTVCILLSISTVALSSCITSSLVAASGAVAGADALVKTTSSGIKTISSMFDTGAPESIASHTLTLKGETRVATGSEAIEKSLAFTADNACKDSSSLFQYVRASDTKATLTETTADGNTKHTYRLTFTDGDEGLYTYESRLTDGTIIATGDGSFELKSES